MFCRTGTLGSGARRQQRSGGERYGSGVVKSVHFSLLTPLAHTSPFSPIDTLLHTVRFPIVVFSLGHAIRLITDKTLPMPFDTHDLVLSSISVVQRSLPTPASGVPNKALCTPREHSLRSEVPQSQWFDGEARQK